MKTLILMRHAKTEQLEYGTSKSDFERELKPRGYKDIKLIASEIIRFESIPDLIISSTASRAKQTAQNLAEHLSYDQSLIRYEQFIYDGYTTTDFLSFMEQLDSKYDTIAVVGHNPEIAMMAVNLCNDNIFHFPTSATISISFDQQSWKEIKAREGKTNWFTYPSMLR
ncbi:SixA phosphatase family protein [Carboxylicivirga sp. N1Y90]|uniref:SixA phosphatase family protein n=1 Tax=Carboxylicivirga fragile TaxID=3417571 RepID=UPI003D34960B|nr:histidine phosphatase family protein [Marinilabiliaceae bacterium N1Y90]